MPLPAVDDQTTSLLPQDGSQQKYSTHYWIATATEKKEIQQNLQQPAKTVDIVPNLRASHSLLSTSKFANASYITMLMLTTVQIYDREITKITASQPPVLTGWQNELSRLWHVPLTAQHTSQEPSSLN